MTLREAAQQALEALEQTNRTGDTQVLAMYCEEVIPALRAALAEPEPKERVGGCTLCGYCAATGEPIHPPQRKPLTDEQIFDLIPSPGVRGPIDALWFARAIERAHGIGEKA